MERENLFKQMEITKGNHWFRFRTGGIIIKDNKMLFVKNFFKGVGGAIDGFDCHTMEFYYLMTIQEDCVDTNYKRDYKWR